MNTLIMKNIKIKTGFLLLLLVFSVLSACKKDVVKWDTIYPSDKETVPQYGVPFDSVPETSDIIMYEVNNGAFSANGNLEGVRSKLDEIKELGINVIWLMPTYPIGELNGIGSPYAVRDYLDVNPAFGDLDDLRLLVKEAHARNMAVILDWVANHTSWDNAWIQDKSWYMQDESGNIISPNGWNDVAELNYSNQDMRTEMIKAMKYWVLAANVDGYRCDYAEGVPDDFWDEAIDTIRNIPNRKLIMFAEAGDKDLLNHGFDLTFGWDFYNKLIGVVNNNQPTSGLVAVNNEDYNNIPEGKHILRWISNHDNDFVDGAPIDIFNGKEGSLAAYVVSAYMGGVPLVYSGQEVGCPQKLSFFADSYTKIDWSINPEMLLTYQNLNNFRKSSTAIRTGSIETYTANSDVIAFKRTSGSEEVLVIVNLNNSQLNFQIPGDLQNTSWFDAFDNSQVTLENTISLQPYEYLVLKN